MILMKAMKYPVLVIGVVLFLLYITNPKTKEWWSTIGRNRIPNTCRVIKDRVAPKAPNSWSFECPTTKQLVIDIKYEVLITEPKNLRQVLYKEIANSLTKFGGWSNLETLEFLPILKLNINHPKMTIKSQTDGQAIVELMAKKNKIDIARHLKLTVKVKEIKK